MPEKSKCKACNADLLWVRTAATGSLMPLDALPVSDGNVAIKDGVAIVLHGELFEEFCEGPYYKSHFATCTEGPRFRKKRKR